MQLPYIGSKTPLPDTTGYQIKKKAQSQVQLPLFKLLVKGLYRLPNIRDFSSDSSCFSTPASLLVHRLIDLTDTSFYNSTPQILTLDLSACTGLPSIAFLIEDVLTIIPNNLYLTKLLLLSVLMLLFMSVVDVVFICVVVDYFSCLIKCKFCGDYAYMLFNLRSRGNYICKWGVCMCCIK